MSPLIVPFTNRSFAAALAAVALIAWPDVAAAQVNAVRSSLKVRPTDSVAVANSIELRAGKNEFEAFQVVIAGGASGRTSVNVTAPTLQREGGSETIPADDVRLYREHTINFTSRSNPEGATGDWRDALIPKVEDGVAVSSPTGSEIASTNEARNGFPFNIAANRNEVVWVDIHVPATQASGRYTGTLTVTAGGTTLGTIGVTFLVHSFSIPATSSLPTAFGLAGDQLCRAHGDVLNNYCPSLARIRTWSRLYARFLQDHRITAWLPDDPNPSNPSAAATDYVNGYAALINGTDFLAQRRLKNADGTAAKSTTVMFPWFRTADSEATFKSKVSAFITMTQNNGWFSKAFHYGKPDEPNANCTSWNTIRNQGIWAHQVNSSFRVMVTGNIGDANTCLGAANASNDLDIMDPVLNHMEVVSGYEAANRPIGNRRADYNAFLSGANNQLWMYQSCMSHGCGDNNGLASKNFPNLMVDSTGVQNRSEPWMHYIYNARQGMLYYETALLLPTAWNSPNGIWSTEFGGQGDGTLLYPGTPAKIGGSTHIPVASIRLKLLREGLEDYEYLLKCETAKGASTAQNIALGMFPAPSMVATSDFNGSTRNPSLYTSRLETKRTDLLTCLLPTPQLTVALSGSGTVTSSPSGLSCAGASCTGTWTEGTRVTLTATPSSGSTFSGWSGGGCSGTGQCVVNLFAASSVTASFSSGNATLTVSKSGAGTGSVSSSPSGISCPSDCAETYAYGTNVTLTPSAGAGSYFAGWSGACSGTGSCVVAMTAAKSVGAIFNLNAYTLSVSRQGSGSGAVSSSPAGINCGSDCSEPYTYGTSVTLTATPSTGSTFAGWSGGGCTGAGSCVVSVTSATSVTATFTAQQFQLSVSKAGTGTGTVSSSPAGINCGADCAENYNYATSVTLTASAATGSTFAGWSGGGCSGAGTCTVSVTAALTVTATFNTTPSSAVLTVQKNGTGSGTVTSSPAGIDCGASCSASYAVGTSITLTAQAAGGSTFAGWSGGGCSGTGNCTLTLNAATTVTATFNTTPSNYTLTVTTSGTGSGSVDSSPSGIACGATCSASFAAATQVTLTATTMQGSTFGGWSGACSGSVATCTVSMNAATSVNALFNPVQASARTTLFADDFNRTTGLGSNWQVLYGGYTTNGTAAVSATPPVNGNWASVVPTIGTDDYIVEAVMTIPSGSFSSGIVARGNPLAFDSDLYAAQISTDGNLSLYRRNSWTWTSLGSFAAGVIPGQAYTLKLVVTGSNPVHLEAWLDGTQRISTEDASASRITSGLPGIENYAANVQYDSFAVYRAPLFTDSFNRTTGLGASWQVWYGGYSTNGAAAVSATPPSNGNWASIVPSMGTNDYVVEAVMTIPSGSYSSGIVARGDPATFDSDLYAAQISTDGNVTLYRRNSWTWTALGSASVGVVAGRAYTVKLIVTGSDPVHLEAWLDGALQIATEDSSQDRILSGVPGIENYAANVQYDSFTVTEAPMFADSFNRSTGLGNGWTIKYGGYSTDGDAVSAAPPINGNWAKVNSVGSVADLAVETILMLPAGAPYQGVVARSASSEFDQDLYSAQLSYDGNVNIYRRNNWEWTLLGSANIGVVPNQRYRLKLVVTGSAVVHLEAWVDGVKRLEVDDSSPARHLTGGVGMACYNSGVRFDNLSVTSQ